MRKILVFGNIIRDIYIDALDDKRLEKDSSGIEWFDFGFDGSEYFYGDRSEIFSGIKVSEEVLSKFGLFSVDNFSLEFEKNHTDISERYIFCRGSNVSCFLKAKQNKTEFVIPNEKIGVIFVDRSANIDKKFLASLEKFHKANKKVPIICYAKIEDRELYQKISELSNLVFSEEESSDFESRKTCILLNNKIKLNKRSVEVHLDRANKMTKLTAYSIIAGSIVGAIFNGKKPDEALRLAKTNVENSKINETLDLNKLESIIQEEDKQLNDIKLVAKMLVSKDKGILAADESGGSIHKKFESLQIEDTEEKRREYRNIFLSTENLQKYVNGVILFDETARQRADNGENFTKLLIGKGIIPGIKVDKGLKNFANSIETYTEGLGGLEERLKEYFAMGLRFAKWRAAFNISNDSPSDFAIRTNAEILAKYAKICQKSQIVPIVEPEVVYDGDYGIAKSKEVTGKVLTELFTALKNEEVDFSATILKVNMVMNGKKFPVQSSPSEVGKATAEVLRASVPEEIAGVVFLSGGQTVEQATENLQAITNNGPYPWPVTFSFARALQEPALLAWKGETKPEVIKEAQEAFLNRLIKNSEALRKH